jgi:hypothetical protein
MKDVCTSTGQCQWYRGKQVANNTANAIGDPIEGQNICLPPTTANWMVQAPPCLNALTEQNCPKDICVWSTGAQYTPEDVNVTESCGVAFVTTNATAYSTCYGLQSEYLCSSESSCKWYTMACSPNSTQQSYSCHDGSDSFWNEDHCNFECPP